MPNDETRYETIGDSEGYLAGKAGFKRDTERKVWWTSDKSAATHAVKIGLVLREVPASGGRATVVSPYGASPGDYGDEYIDQEKFDWDDKEKTWRAKPDGSESKDDSPNTGGGKMDERLEVAYQVFAGKEGRVTSRRKVFKNSAAADKFLDKLENDGKLYQVVAYSNFGREASGASMADEPVDKGFVVRRG